MALPHLSKGAAWQFRENHVPLVALDRLHAGLAHELHGAFERVVTASAFVLGDEVERFEHEFAGYCGTRHCIGVGSGTGALTIALMANGIGAGDEVIVPAHTFIASALAVVHAGATPVFCDVEEGTALMSPAAAAAAITPRTAALLPVHLYGQCCDMDELGRLADSHGLAIVEDAAQAHGASWRKRPSGSLGRAAAFSFYPTKNLGALGDGGAICTSDDEVARRARALRDLGRASGTAHELPGYNDRLDGLQAAFLRVKLPHLDAWNAERRRSAAAYRSLLGGRVRLLEERAESPCVYHLFPIRVPRRGERAAALARAGVATGVHYPLAVPDQPPFAGRVAGDFPNARTWADTELSLPIFECLESHELEHVASVLLLARS
jgi:dTDP-4-amino-4,6-dideoxygalactose transaminase